MSRYIDAEFEENHYASMLLNPTPDVTQSDKKKARIILEVLRMAKGIDIVRCKECIWFDTDNTGEDYCMYIKGLADANADDFCSYGEREGE